MIQWHKAGRVLKWRRALLHPQKCIEWSLVKSTRVNAGTRAHYKPHASQQNQDKLQAKMHWLSWQQGWLSLSLSEKVPSVRSLLCWLTVVSFSDQYGNPPLSTTTQLLLLYELQIWTWLMAAVKEVSYKEEGGWDAGKTMSLLFLWNTWCHTMLHFTHYYIDKIGKIPAI